MDRAGEARWAAGFNVNCHAERDSTEWFCIRSLQKQEHIAAANLGQITGVESWDPRIRTKKCTVRGPVTLMEPLFPCYLFARFDFKTMLDRVKYTPGVATVVHFGGRYPAIPDRVIDDLKHSIDACGVRCATDRFRPGDIVTVTDAAFYGLQGTVLQTLPGKQRVRVLLDILGRSASVELSVRSVMAENACAAR